MTGVRLRRQSHASERHPLGEVDRGLGLEALAASLERARVPADLIFLIERVALFRAVHQEHIDDPIPVHVVDGDNAAALTGLLLREVQGRGAGEIDGNFLSGRRQDRIKIEGVGPTNFSQRLDDGFPRGEAGIPHFLQCHQDLLGQAFTA